MLVHYLCSLFIYKAYWNVKMKCSKCGHNVVEKKAKFCSICGNRLSAPTEHTQGKFINQNVDSLSYIELLIAVVDYKQQSQTMYYYFFKLRIYMFGEMNYYNPN